MNTNDESKHVPVLSQEEFDRRLREEPGFGAGLRKSMEAALALPDGPETAAMKEAVRRAMAAHDRYIAARGLEETMANLLKRVEEVRRSRDPEDIREVNARMDDLVDAVLDVPEPDRTELMKSLTKVQANLREIAKEI